nr:hypothetical protein [uncultured Cohaesibacter sp.]
MDRGLAADDDLDAGLFNSRLVDALATAMFAATMPPFPLYAGKKNGMT